MRPATFSAPFLGMLAALAALFCLLAAPAKATNIMFPKVAPPHVNMVGVGMGFYPQFEGSSDYYFGAAPLVRYHFDGERYVQILINELRVNLLDDPSWDLGPLALWRFGRYDVDDDVVDRMDSIHDTAELGAFFNYSLVNPDNPLKRLTMGAFGQADVGGVHDGWLASAHVDGLYPLVEFLSLTGGAATTWASEGYNDTYFGVSGSDALQSGLQVYSPGAGMRDVRTYMGLIFHMSLNWHVGGGALYSHILGPDNDSPIVTERGDPNQWVYGLGLIYSW